MKVTDRLVLILLGIFLNLSSCSDREGGEIGRTLLSYHFADLNYTYRAGVDKGFSKYLAISLHGTKKVVLTFDDGPHPLHTPRLLNILDDYGVKATFFVLGKRARKYPDIIKDISRRGHILALHTVNHANSNKLSREDFEREIVKSVDILEGNGWEGPEWYFRFPYGAYGSEAKGYHHFESLKGLGLTVFGENCFNFVFWDIDTSDWYLKKLADPVDKIATTTLSLLEGGPSYDFFYHRKYGKPRIVKKGMKGGVILMHDIHKTSVDSVPEILERLISKGYQIISLNEVKEFSYDNEMNCFL